MRSYNFMKSAQPRGLKFYHQQAEKKAEWSWLDHPKQKFSFANYINFHVKSAVYKHQLQQQRPDATEVFHAPGFNRPFNPEETSCLRPMDLIPTFR